MIDWKSWVTIEKRVLSNVPRRRGPRESRWMAGSMGPKAYEKVQEIYYRETGIEYLWRSVLCK